MDKNSLLKLDNQLCFAIYACAKEITGLYRPFLEPLGLTYTQYIALLVLWEKDDITLKELGAKLFLDSGTLTPVLKKMETAGLIVRERSQDDERSLRIRLTDSGWALKTAAYEIPEKVFCASHLSLDEAVLLRTHLHDMLRRMTECKCI